MLSFDEVGIVMSEILSCPQTLTTLHFENFYFWSGSKIAQLYFCLRQTLYLINFYWKAVYIKNKVYYELSNQILLVHLTSCIWRINNFSEYIHRHLMEWFCNQWCCLVVLLEENDHIFCMLTDQNESNTVERDLHQTDVFKSQIQ